MELQHLKSLHVITETGASTVTQAINPSLTNIISARLLKLTIPMGVLGGIDMLVVRSKELTAKGLTPAYESGYQGDILGVQSVDPVSGTASWNTNPTMFFYQPQNLNAIDIVVTTADNLPIPMGGGDKMSVILELGHAIPLPTY
jgi:hypothetical protein